MSWLSASGGQSIGTSASAKSPSNEYSGLISFRIDWSDLLAVQRTLKSFLQDHNSKALILWHFALGLHVRAQWSPRSSRRTTAALVRARLGFLAPL